MELGPYRSRSLNTLLAGIGLRDTQEWQMLASNFYSGWGEESFEFSLEDERVDADTALEAARQRVRSHHAYAEEQLHNSETVALKGWEYDGDKLQAKMVGSDHVTHLAYGELEGGRDSIPLGCSALSVGVHVVTHDNMVVIARQGAKKEGALGFSFEQQAGMGEVKGGRVDVVGCAVRGAREQMGLAVARGSFVFTGWGLSRAHGGCAVWGLAYLGLDWSEMWLEDERWEHQEAWAVPFRVENVLEAMQRGVGGYGAQLGLLEALIYQYGVDTVFEAVGAKAGELAY